MVASDETGVAAGWPLAADRVRLEVPALTDYTRIARLTASGLAHSHGFALEQVEAWRLAVDRALDLLVAGEPPHHDAEFHDHPETDAGERLSITFDLSPTHIGAVFSCRPSWHASTAQDAHAWQEFSRGVAALVDAVEIDPEQGSISLAKWGPRR